MNIHILSNSPTRVNSGFGIVTRNLALQLQKLNHTISVSDMQNIYNKEYWNNITIYPLNSVQGATGNQFYTSELRQLTKNLKESKSEVLLIIYPAYNEVIASNHLHEVFKPTLWYYPVEGENVPKIYTDELKKVHTVIPMTKQGKVELERSGLKNIHNIKGMNKEIYHGFDPEIFHELNINTNIAKAKNKDSECLHYCKWSEERYQYMGDKKLLCERGCFKCNGGRDGECKHYEEENILINVLGEEYTGKISNLATLKEQFGVETIFLFNGDNNGTRKKIDRLLHAYSLFCKKNNESLLLMHTLPVSDSGLNLFEYIKKYKLDNFEKSKVVFTYGTDDLGNSWSERALNIMYNISDVCVSASSGEGFNLPLLESMACGKSNIGTNFSSFIELIGDDNDETMNRGMLCDVEGYEKLPSGLKRALVSYKCFADCMEIIHDDKNMKKKFEDNSYEWVQKYTWNDIAKEFDNLMVVYG